LVTALVAIPCLHLALLYRRRYPLTALLHRLPFVHRSARWVRFLRASEWMAGRFCQHHPRALLGALGVSLVAGAWMIVDYMLMVRFLSISLTLWKSIAGWTAGWLSFLLPLPGGLGALEASQVFALGRFGTSAGAALGVALLMRGRDLLIAGTGLLLAGRGWKRRAVTVSPIPREP
jgi:uncharacterized membrane protein YbhN (UPF0104 family)